LVPAFQKPFILPLHFHFILEIVPEPIFLLMCHNFADMSLLTVFGVDDSFNFTIE
jgi:hypothetical protein